MLEDISVDFCCLFIVRFPAFYTLSRVAMPTDMLLADRNALREDRNSLK